MLKYFLSKIFKKMRLSSILNSSIHKTSKVESGSSFINSKMDKHSFCGYDCDINHTFIGSFCSIANGVTIGGGMHPSEWVSTSPVFFSERDSVKAKFSKHERKKVQNTVIGHDVWIGQNVIIKQGVNIGTGAIIGMGSIVTKDVPPYNIYAGNPAKFIRKRFDDKVIDSLLKSEWWHMEEIKLEQYAKYITNPSKFINSIK